MDPNLSRNPQDTFRSDLINQLIENVSNKTGVPKVWIMPIINFQSNFIPGNGPIDGLVALALNKMIRSMADQYARNLIVD